jgi:hypothetical protein
LSLACVATLTGRRQIQMAWVIGNYRHDCWQ